VARGVDEVHLGAAPLHAGRLGENGDATLAFLVVVVHHALHYVLVRGEGAGLAQQFVDQRRFAVVNVRDDGDVANELVQEGDSSLSSPAIWPSSSNTTP